jgi:hypothetical protein
MSVDGTRSDNHEKSKNLKILKKYLLQNVVFWMPCQQAKSDAMLGDMSTKNVNGSMPIVELACHVNIMCHRTC